jgi:hypothetical protein
MKNGLKRTLDQLRNSHAFPAYQASYEGINLRRPALTLGRVTMPSRRTWVTLVVVGWVLVVCWFVSGFPRGVLTASFDHARGRYEILTFGKPGSEREECRRLLADRYGVKLRAVAGCVVSFELVQYVEGYNSASRHLLKERHGRDIFEECLQLSRKGTGKGPER